MCVVDVRVRPRSSVGILEEALDLTVDLCTALSYQGRPALARVASESFPTDLETLVSEVLSPFPKNAGFC